jgi:hypothetical protein
VMTVPLSSSSSSSSSLFLMPFSGVGFFLLLTQPLDIW